MSLNLIAVLFCLTLVLALVDLVFYYFINDLIVFLMSLIYDIDLLIQIT